MDSKNYPFNGKFWSISKDNNIVKIYEKEDIVYEVNENNTAILRTVPVKDHGLLKKCDSCGKIATQMVEFEHGFHMCRDCYNNFGDLVDDWEDTRRTLVTGSEDYPF